MTFKTIYPFCLKESKLKKLIANLNNKSKHVIHLRNLKQLLNHRLVLKKVHRVVKFNQEVLLKP